MSFSIPTLKAFSAGKMVTRYNYSNYCLRRSNIGCIAGLRVLLNSQIIIYDSCSDNTYTDLTNSSITVTFQFDEGLTNFLADTPHARIRYLYQAACSSPPANGSTTSYAPVTDGLTVTVDNGLCGTRGRDFDFTVLLDTDDGSYLYNNSFTDCCNLYGYNCLVLSDTTTFSFSLGHPGGTQTL